MFKLLGLILDYCNRISGTTEINVGENVGQNTPAETSRTMVEQGQKIYTAIFKRIWRSLKKEFQKLYQLNSVYLPREVTFGAKGSTIGREDYRGSPGAVVPVADPTISSAGERYARAAAVKQLSVGNPAYDPDEVEKNILNALGVTDIEKIYKGVANAPPPQPDIKLQIEQMRTQVKMAELEQARNQMIVTLQENRRLNDAKIIQLQAQAFKLMEEGENVKAGQQIEAFRAAMELMREQGNLYDKQIQSLMEIGKNELESRGTSPIIPSLEGPSSNTAGLPVVAGQGQTSLGGLA